MRKRSRTVRGDLFRVFALQALALSFAVVLGVFLAAKVVEKALVKEALQGEAAHFWSLYDRDAHAPRPDTRNLRGYLRHPQHGDEIPAWLADLEPGFQRVEYREDKPLVHISDRGAARLYLVFDEIQVSRLAMFFGVAPLSLVLLLVYSLTFIGYRLSRSAVSPLVRLAGKVQAIDARSRDLAGADFEVGAPINSEVHVLASALQAFVSRIGEFVTRERTFTRNASHELRTPLAVLQTNVNALRRRAGDDPDLSVPLDRMQRTITDMEKLLETLLILAREDESRLPTEGILVNDLLAERIEQLQRAETWDQVSIRIDAGCLLRVQAPSRALGIVFDNILRNAVHYTHRGQVNVRVQPGRVQIVDDGPGIEKELLNDIFEPFRRGASGAGGYGLGLAIVKRLCDGFGWRVSIESELGRGTTVTLDLPESEVVGRPA